MSGLLLVGLLFLALGLGACSPSDDDESGPSVSLADPAVDVDGESPDRLASGRTIGDRLRLGLQRPPSYLPDEVVLTDQSAVIVSDLLYDGLTEAVGVAAELRPGIAVGWSADPTFTEWQFELDPTSGVTADDVVRSLTALVDSRGGRAGIAAVLAADIAAVRAVDEATVSIVLNGPNAGLPWVLSGLPYSIVGPSGEFTGDYEVTSDDTNGMILSRRAERATSAADVPAEIVMTWSPTPAEAADLLASELVDAVIVPTTDSPGDTLGSSTIAEWSNAAVTTSAIRFYVLNAHASALTDPATRRAVLGAVDQAALVVESTVGGGTAIDGLLGPTMAGYRPDACGELCRPDGGATGLSGLDELRLHVSYAGDEQRETAAAIAEQLAAAGVEAEHSELAAEDLARAIVRGETDMFAFGWVAPATSGDSVLPPLLAVDSPANIAKIASPEVAQLLDQAAVTAADDARWELLNQAHRAALGEALILPIAGSTSILVMEPALQGLEVRADGSIDLDSMQ